MKSFILVALTVGCVFGARPGVWNATKCPPHNELENYVFYGEDAPDGKFPYMLSLRYKNTKKHKCGASVLTKNWALTAAQCCADFSEDPVYVYSGSNVLSKGGKDHEIESLKIHEKYDPENFWVNDICLIKVKTPFVYSNKVKQITLPTQNMTIKDGTLVTITGWGYTKPAQRITPDKLQVGKNYVAWSQERCYDDTRIIDDSFLCVMGATEDQGACYGDSGSPLVKDGVQLGVASWVFFPCACGFPDYYARVPIFIDWIKKNLGKEASELKFVK